VAELKVKTRPGKQAKTKRTRLANYTARPRSRPIRERITVRANDASAERGTGTGKKKRGRAEKFGTQITQEAVEG